MRIVFGFLVFLCLFFYGMIFLTPLKEYHYWPSERLEGEYYATETELYLHEKNNSLPAGGVQSLHKLRKYEKWLGLEIQRRKSRIDMWMPLVGLLGIFGFFAVTAIGRRSGARGRLKKKGEAVSGDIAVTISEAQPREEYVDEYEFARRSEGGFKRKDDAIAWVSQDPMRRCDYCDGQMRPTFTGSGESIQHITFYKKVPEGARDLRVVLGSLWFVKEAAELKCASCGKIVKR